MILSGLHIVDYNYIASHFPGTEGRLVLVIGKLLVQGEVLPDSKLGLSFSLCTLPCGGYVQLVRFATYSTSWLAARCGKSEGSFWWALLASCSHCTRSSAGFA